VRRTGLKEALLKELAYVDGLKKQDCDLEISGDHYSLSPEHELLIYRVAQEAIHNCIKHAKASTIKVLLGYEPQLFTLTISDNGAGFNLADQSAARGIGISHMKHRAKVMESELAIHSELARGTTITLKVPTLYGQQHLNSYSG
jgi:signal transduction histidine kinase